MVHRSFAVGNFARESDSDAKAACGWDDFTEEELLAVGARGYALYDFWICPRPAC